MKLRYIGLTADDEFGKIDDSFYERIYHNVEFICRFIDVEIRKLKIETERYNMIGIILHPSKEGCDERYIANVLEVYVLFTEEDIKQLSTLSYLPQRYEYYLSLLERGYRVAINCGHTEIPLNALLQIHQQFRERGYKCEWLWKKKLLRKDNMYLFFNVHFTTFYLSMELTVMDKRKTKVRCCETLTKMMPYLYVFRPLFRNLEIMENEIVITDWLDEVYLSIDRHALQKDNIITTYHHIRHGKDIWSDEQFVKRITW